MLLIPKRYVGFLNSIEVLVWITGAKLTQFMLLGKNGSNCSHRILFQQQVAPSHIGDKSGPVVYTRITYEQLYVLEAGFGNSFLH